MLNAISDFFLRKTRQRGDGNLLELSDFVRAPRDKFQRAVRRRTQFAYLGDGVGICRMLGRYKVFIDTTDIGLSPHFALEGYWEMWVTEYIMTRLKRGMIAVDVGANLGYFTMIMADMVGASGRVHAFEPNPKIANLLRRSVHVNGFLPSVEIHSEALGEENGGRFRLEVPENYPGGAWLMPAEGSYVGRLTEMRRLDSYTDILDADIIKIDAEGGEYGIWRGMTGLLERGRPLTVLIEFVPGRYDEPGVFLDSMLSAGFQLHYIDFVRSLQAVTKDEILSWPAETETMLVLIR